MRNKWTLLLFLCTIFFVYTIDRSMLGVLAISIQKELGLSDIQLGVLNAAIFWTYAALVPVSGVIGDRFNRSWIIGCALIAWSTMMIASGCANGFWSLMLFVSFAVTAPQTLYGPSANALIASCHDKTRATALSLHQAAHYSGWFASGIVVSAIVIFFGSWRSAYFVFGGVGIVLGVVFLILERFRGDIVSNTIPSRPPTRMALKAFFYCPRALLLSVGYVAVVFVSFGYSAWGPKFVAIKFGLSPERAAAGVMFWHYAAALAAGVVAGAVSDVYVKRWPRFRLIVSSLSLLLSAPMFLLFGQSSSVFAVFTAAAVFGVMRGLFEANIITMLFDVIMPQFRASAVGFLNVIAGVVGSLSPILIGAFSDRYGLQGFEYAFAGFGGILSIAVIFFLGTFRTAHLP